ncbi:MAG: cytochrome b/b6 domain-containing protein, partial [Anaerolineae bacterium]|nr:cytochrome b/b6 domain-containing protein [Anaerolineae bacterium]
MMRQKGFVPLLLSIATICFVLAGFLLSNSFAVAQEETEHENVSLRPVEPVETVIPGSSLHPTFPILDEDGNHVLESGKPVSALQTCGACHDTTFISQHSVHADVGQSIDGGWYAEWNPITYADTDMTVAEWEQELGWRHVGGGPTEEIGVEMNCFLCHYSGASTEARLDTIAAGDFADLTTASLCGSGLVSDANGDCTINPEAFDADGNLLPEYVRIGEPTDAACGQCHGIVHDEAQIPLEFNPYLMTHWTTYTTGQLFSPQDISNSAMNIENRNEVTRSWDVHAERVVNCIDCHYSLNNPVVYVEDASSRPEHRDFDPCRMEINDYLERPLHQFANGGADYADAFPVFDGAMRDCATCHNAETTHTWLPYSQRHMQALQCETCHIPTLYAPALASLDWTVLDASGEPVVMFRGVDPSSNPDLITGYEPVLMPDEEGKIAPYNLISAWYWVSGEQATPVSKSDLQAAYFDGDAYHADVIAAFDANGDGSLDSAELLIDTDEKESIIAERLTNLGYEDPRIVAETEAYEVHHNVAQGEWAIRECSTCHAEDTRFAQAIALSDRTPGGVLPDVGFDGTASTLETDDTGALLLVPEIDLEPIDLYVLGRDSVALVDWAGILIFLATMAGVFVHGGLRVLAARRMPAPEDPDMREVYMYTIYERQWHWLQSALIFGLIFTGIVIHKPHMFAFLSFRWVVLVHNAFALILIINAALAAFYHLVSGEIRQFLPEPRGFFGQMFAQARYYAWGIFRGEPHPIEKTPDHKLNPIQQLTYFGLLNVLLPLQVITGTLMWGAQHFPGVTDFFGGLPLLAPFHSLIAW